MRIVAVCLACLAAAPAFAATGNELVSNAPRDFPLTYQPELAPPPEIRSPGLRKEIPLGALALAGVAAVASAPAGGVAAAAIIGGSFGAWMAKGDYDEERAEQAAIDAELARLQEARNSKLKRANINVEGNPVPPKELKKSRLTLPQGVIH